MINTNHHMQGIIDGEHGWKAGQSSDLESPCSPCRGGSIPESALASVMRLQGTGVNSRVLRTSYSGRELLCHPFETLFLPINLAMPRMFHSESMSEHSAYSYNYSHPELTIVIASRVDLPKGLYPMSLTATELPPPYSTIN
jgi:hypothetical protein